MAKRAKESKKEDSKIKESLHYQLMFRLFLRNLRENKGWSAEDFAKVIGASLPKVHKLESRTIPSPIVSYVNEIKEIADLAEIGADSLVSIILGKKNENNEDNSFSAELLQDINCLDGLTQIKIKEILSSNRAAIAIEAVADILKTQAVRLQTLKNLAKLSDSQFKLIQLMANEFLKDEKENVRGD